MPSGPVSKAQTSYILLLNSIYQWIQENKDVYKKDPDTLIVRLMLVHRKYIHFIYKRFEVYDDLYRDLYKTKDTVSGEIFDDFYVMLRKKICDRRNRSRGYSYWRSIDSDSCLAMSTPDLKNTPELRNRIITIHGVLDRFNEAWKRTRRIHNTEREAIFDRQETFVTVFMKSVTKSMCEITVGIKQGRSEFQF
jgi:hypothetical protein